MPSAGLRRESSFTQQVASNILGSCSSTTSGRCHGRSCRELQLRSAGLRWQLGSRWEHRGRAVRDPGNGSCRGRATKAGPECLQSVLTVERTQKPYQVACQLLHWSGSPEKWGLQLPSAAAGRPIFRNLQLRDSERLPILQCVRILHRPNGQLGPEPAVASAPPSSLNEALSIDQTWVGRGLYDVSAVMPCHEAGENIVRRRVGRGLSGSSLFDDEAMTFVPDG